VGATDVVVVVVVRTTATEEQGKTRRIPARGSTENRTNPTDSSNSTTSTTNTSSLIPIIRRGSLARSIHQLLYPQSTFQIGQTRIPHDGLDCLSFE